MKTVRSEKNLDYQQWKEALNVSKIPTVYFEGHKKINYPKRTSKVKIFLIRIKKHVNFILNQFKDGKYQTKKS